MSRDLSALASQEMGELERRGNELAAQAAAEGCILLENNGVLPLKPQKAAIYGYGARLTMVRGIGSGDVTYRYTVNIEQGLENAGFTVTTKKWLGEFDALYADYRVKLLESVAKETEETGVDNLHVLYGRPHILPDSQDITEEDVQLSDTDLAIYVMSRKEGEGLDNRYVKGEYLPSDQELKQIRFLRDHYKKVVLLLNTGTPIELKEILEIGPDAVMAVFQGGAEAGNVIAGLLTGKYNPSGKTTSTWAIDYMDHPTSAEFGPNDGNTDTEVYKEGVYLGYRYFDSFHVKPLYPFGYGKSYTTFRIDGGSLTNVGSRIILKAKVKNTGSVPGKEVVQVYVSVPSGRLDQPYQTLAAFKKTRELKAQERETLTLSFRLSDLASFDTENEAMVLEKGSYIVRVGNSSENTKPEGVLYLPGDRVIRHVRHIGGETDFTDIVPEHVPVNVPENVKVIELDASSFPEIFTEYDKEIPTEEIAEEMTDEELALMSIGAFDEKKGMMAVIGNSSFSVAGAAGETSDKLKEKGIGHLVMSDGPAGLRISRDYFIGKDQKPVTIGETLPQSMIDFMPKAIVGLTHLMAKKPKKGTQIFHQYATAIPVGTAIAQSWDPGVAEICGDVVGSEMEHFGVHLWLAPAMNIHRDIRCGRNYEYYSEDPLLSGLFAAGITKGVQKHAKCGTTIKHFCANNQETNRYANNSIVSERALREIYLRGFAICIRESRPHALMTSYNLLNGVHTSERRDIAQDFLKAECGFEGIIMTDWIAGTDILSRGSLHGVPCASKTAAAGGHLYMPGQKSDYDDILKALKEGTLERRQLVANVSETIRMIRLIGDDNF